MLSRLNFDEIINAGQVVQEVRRNSIDVWIRSHLDGKYADWAAKLKALLSIYDRAQRSRRLDSGEVIQFEEAVRQNGKPAETAAELLGELARRFEEAAFAVENLLEDPKPSIRLKGLIALYAIDPNARVFDQYRTALRDKNAKVRVLAADHALRRRLKTLVSDLSTQILAEEDRDVRAHLIHARDLLRHGFHKWRDESGTLLITKIDKNGGFSTTVLNEKH